jgi:hypothetical protein
MRYGPTEQLASFLKPALSFVARHRNRQAIFYRAAFALFLLTNALQATTFKAAVAKADITPSPGLAMYGFLDRIKDNKLSTGTLDPLYARVLVLEAVETRLALVTLDLGRTFNEGELTQLREEVKSAAGISFLIVTASHTHSGPNILDVYPGGRTPAWERAAIKKIVAISSTRGSALGAAKFTSGITVGWCIRMVRSRCYGPIPASSPRLRSIPPLWSSVLTTAKASRWRCW